MKKLTTLFTAITAITLSASAMAEMTEDDIFIGFEAGYGQSKVNASTFGSKKDDDTTAYGLRVGSTWDDEVRGYFTISQYKPDDVTLHSGAANTLKVKSIEQLNLLLSADYLFLQGSDFQPFIGGTIGATEIKAKGMKNTESADYKKKWDFAYGVQGGILFHIDSIDLEAGVRYQSNDAEHKWKKDNGHKLKVTESRQVYAAASIHF
ncbi:outer membrane beta-barrel protein [uncultured Endozoicomonas sp.]|uniref:outer membrane beta-barrel protein n=1 Tax=uncultured Endozoicomonas sp. TaxID=432652 RepID=UPI00260345A5|nr:outer membrane beta-barrel protein [uncultured Endozoicomonas sp.]